MRKIFKTVTVYLRGLGRRPAFTAGAVLSLALGIGANTAIFSCVNAILLRPLPVERPDRLVTVYATSADAPGDFWGHSYLNFLDYREGIQAFSSMTVFRPVSLRLTGKDQAEQINGEMVAGNYFETLGVRPFLGRTFLAEEDRTPGTHPVTVLGYGMWQRRFGSDPGVIGKVIPLNGQPFTIIGVAPKGFRGVVTLGSPEVWVPTMMHGRVLYGRIADWFDDRDALILNTVGRLKPGVSMKQAEVELREMAARLEQAHPVENKGVGIAVLPLTQAAIHYSLRNTIVLASKVLMILVGILLLVTVANVANLLLARALERRKEVAVRLSIGASRGQLAQQLIIEGLVLSFLGGALGLVVAHWGKNLLWTLRPSFVPAAIDIQLDARVLGFTLLLCLVTGLLFGLAPMLQVRRLDLVPALKDLPTTPERAGLRHILLITQVAFSFVSLVGAGLFLQSLRSSQKIDPGFETEKLALAAFDLGPQGYSEPAGRAFQRQLLERVGTLPGVRSAALAERVMFDFRGFSRLGVRIDGQEPPPMEEGSMVRINPVGPRYFETVDMKLQRGRGFSDQDREGAPQVAVINASMADRFWPGRSSLGEHFRFADEKDFIRVVGIVESGNFQALGQKDEPLIFLPLLQRYSPAVTLHIRTSGDPAAILPSLRREIRSLDRHLPLTSERTASQVMAESLWAPRTSALLLSFFSLTALLLAIAGVYSTTAFSVRSRTQEFGIRRALGAQSSDLVRIVLLEGGKLVAYGLLLGTLLAALAMPHVSALLSGISRLGGSLVFVAAGLVLLTVALAANLFPAREAMKAELTRALWQG